jgi:hypothetical protein
MRSGVGRENIEDQAGTIHHPRFQQLLEVARLAGGQLVVEYDQIVLEFIVQRGDLLGLAGADEVLREGPFEPLVHAPDDIEAGGIGQQRQLAQGVLGAPGAAVAGQIGADEEGALARGFGREEPPTVRAGGDGRFGYSRTPSTKSVKLPASGAKKRSDLRPERLICV